MSRPDLLTRVLAVLLLIASVYFGLGYLKERQQQNELVARMNDTLKTLALIPRPPSDLPQQLADAKQANTAARQTVWPDRVDTTRVIKSVLAAADAAAVKAIPLTTEQWTTRTINNSTYRVLTLKLSFEGSLANLSNLINRLYASEFDTLAVEMVTVTRVSGQTPGAANSPGLLSGTLDLAVFTQPAN